MESPRSTSNSILHLPYLKNRNIAILYFTYFAGSFWAMLGMWYVYFLGVVSPQQIAIVHTVGFIAGIAMDIPSGFLADKFGRKRFLSIGLVTFAVGIGLFAFIENIWQMIFFEIITQVGIACISGAQEAVLYDTVYAMEDDKKKVDDIFALIYSRCRMIINVSLITSAIIGGALYRFSDKAGWLMMSGLCLIAFVLTLTMQNHQQTGQSIEIQVLSHTKTSIKIFTSKINRYLIPAILIFGGLAFTSDWGIFPMGSMERVGYTPLGISIFFSLLYVVCIFANHYLPTIAKRLGNYLGFKYFGITTALLMIIGIGLFKIEPYLIVIPLAVFVILSSLMLSYMTVVISQISDETNRATMLSISSFSSKFLYLISGPLMGYSFAHNAPEYSWLGYGLLSIIGVFICGFIFKKYKKQLSQQST